ncbi:hypothetical protein C8F01DRAFT_1184281 [Mycena amicta]|nr:hypothetical protein C8F01DRAFT_1184281 [Mycena amicta]
MLFYGLNLLVVLCACASVKVHAMKIHTPGRHGMQVSPGQTGVLPVSWTEEPNDPLRFALVVNSLIGGETQQVPRVFESGNGTADVPVSVGTFTISAVDPNNPSTVFTSSKTFTVAPNGIGIDSNDADAANAPGAPPISGDPNAVAGSGPDLTSSPSTSTTAPITSSTASSTGLKPAIIGAIAAGAAVLLLLLGFALFVFIRRHHARTEVIRRTTFHRSRMVRQPAADSTAVPPLPGYPADLEKAAGMPNPYLGSGYGGEEQMEFDDVSIEGSSISISTISDLQSIRYSSAQPSSYTHSHAAPSSYAASSTISRAHSTRREPELYTADLRPQRYKSSQDKNKPAYPFSSA